MAKNSLFKGSFFGYRKADVNNYIELLGIKFTDRENELEAEIKRLNKELEPLPSLATRKEELEVLVAKLEEENDALRRENESKTAALEENIKETEELKAKLENDRSSFEKHAEEMLLQIQEQAKSVIDKANETAALIISNARKKASASKQDSVGTDNQAHKKDSLSDLFESHKSKMDSFFSAIAKSFTGEGKQ